MSNINLLPWRAQLQTRQTQRILWQLVLVCALTVAAVSVAQQYVKRQEHEHQLRYGQLLRASTELDDTLRHIELVRLQGQQLRVRNDLIIELQPRRGQALRLLNQLPAWLPIGVRLDSVQLASGALEIKGQAQSYEQLALLVQRIEQATWLSEPRLQAQVLPDAMLSVTQSKAKQFSLQLNIIIEPPPAPSSAPLFTANQSTSAKLLKDQPPAYISARLAAIPSALTSLTSKFTTALSAQEEP